MNTDWGREMERRLNAVADEVRAVKAIREREIPQRITRAAALLCARLTANQPCPSPSAKE